MDEIMQEVLALARKKMREAGEYDREAFRQYVEESIDYYIEKGRLSEDDNLDLLQEQLMELHAEVESKEADE